MTDELRAAIGIFELFAEVETTLSSKAHLEILCRGHAAAARGWRLIATGQGQEKEILTALEEACVQLMGAERQPRGRPALEDVTDRDPADEMVILRYYERQPTSLSLRHFVEKAFDAGEIDARKRFTIDVHVNRLQRRIDRE